MTIKNLITFACFLLGTSLFAQAQRDTVHIHIYDTIRVTDRRTAPPPTIISRDRTTIQQINTTAINQEQAVFDFSTADVDSIVFYRKLDAPIPSIIVITRVDSLLYFRDTLFFQPRLRVVDVRWLTSLGVASFATDSVWTVTNGRATQVWSDAVQTHRCSNRTEFNCGTLYNGEWAFHVDCRSNPGFPGNLFSWQAVYELRYELCPYPWRVPTAQDFFMLDIIMGGTGRIRSTTPQLIIDNYITRWGGAFSGAGNPSGDLWYQGWWGDYWSLSLSERSANYGISLTFGEFGTVNSRDYDYRHDGLSLRCIRR